MAQIERPTATDWLDRQIPNLEHLFHETLTSHSNAAFNLAKGLGCEKVQGLPDLQIVGLEHKKSPWDQPAESRNGWETFKKAFGGGDKIGDRVREQVLKTLTKDQQAQYDQEEAAIKNREVGMGLFPGPMPPCPMHDLVNEKVKTAENQIAASVKALMTPAERRELDKELKAMDDQYNDWKKHFNPLGTGDFGPRITAGPAVRSYFEKVAHAVDKGAAN